MSNQIEKCEMCGKRITKEMISYWKKHETALAAPCDCSEVKQILRTRKQLIYKTAEAIFKDLERFNIKHYEERTCSISNSDLDGFCLCGDLHLEIKRLKQKYLNPEMRKESQIGTSITEAPPNLPKLNSALPQNSGLCKICGSFHLIGHTYDHFPEKKEAKK